MDDGQAKGNPCYAHPLCLTQNLSLIVVGLGAVFSLIFHLGTKEKPYPLGSLPQLEESTPLLQKETKSPASPLLIWKDWLLEPAFYQVRLRAELVAPVLGCCPAWVLWAPSGSGMCPGAGADGGMGCTGHPPTTGGHLCHDSVEHGRCQPFPTTLSGAALSLSPHRSRCSTCPPGSSSTCPRPTSPCT